MATSGSAMPADGMREANRNAVVARYYDYTIPFYRLFWHGRTAGLHYGLADPWTRSPADEIINTNRFLARVSRIDARCRVLDAGCGIGGSAVWLASHLGSRVTGMTLSLRQARHARRLSERHGVADLVNVFVADYTRSSLPDESFDVVWAIESACYADDKQEFIDEALRLLRPGGRLVVADGFLRRNPLPHEEEDLRTFLRGLALPNLEYGARFESGMQKAGFVDVERFDKTGSATPSAQRLRRRCVVAHPISLIGEALGIFPALLTRNIRAGKVQLGLVERGLVGYEVLCGVKPGSARGFAAENTR